MQREYRVQDLIVKVVDESFLVETPRGSIRVVSGTLFGYDEGKYFLLDKVLEKILKLVEITQSWKIDVYDLHDLLYASWIEIKDLIPVRQ